MSDFDALNDLTFNRGPVSDPQAFAREASAASWLFLCGPEFAEMLRGWASGDVEAIARTFNHDLSGSPDLRKARRRANAS